MPFGIRSPSDYIEKHRALMLAQSTNSCHCCTKEIALGEDGHYKLVPTRFEYLIDGEHHERRALLCSTCYGKQRALKFNSLEELMEHLSTRQRLPRTPKSSHKRKPRTGGSPRVVRRAKASLKEFDREFLVDLHRMLGEFLERGETEIDPVAESSELPEEDDLLAGMNDEQRARMDAAAAIAAARTTEVPQENWGKEDVPNGW